MPKLIFAISGASGICLANACLEKMAALPDLELHIIITDAAKTVARHEENIRIPNNIRDIYDNHDLAAPPASGSWLCDGMIICPCSMNAAGCIAANISDNLLLRCAAVTLKEKRPLILVLRETPFSLLMINSMVSLAQAGATVMPFIPSFYSGNESLSGLMSQFCGHILDILKIPNNLRIRWPLQADKIG